MFGRFSVGEFWESFGKAFVASRCTLRPRLTTVAGALLYCMSTVIALHVTVQLMYSLGYPLESSLQLELYSTVGGPGAGTDERQRLVL